MTLDRLAVIHNVASTRIATNTLQAVSQGPGLGFASVA